MALMKASRTGSPNRVSTLRGNPLLEVGITLESCRLDTAILVIADQCPLSLEIRVPIRNVPFLPPFQIVKNDINPPVVVSIDLQRNRLIFPIRNNVLCVRLSAAIPVIDDHRGVVALVSRPRYLSRLARAFSAFGGRNALGAL